jgi:DNA-binding NarL/FixJ family response regulator
MDEKATLIERAHRAVAQAKALEPPTHRTLAGTRIVCQLVETRRAARQRSIVDAELCIHQARVDAGLLSERQLEILGLVAEGLVTKEIAGKLWLSPATVRNHVHAVCRALGAHSRIEAVARARSLGLLD